MKWSFPFRLRSTTLRPELWIYRSGFSGAICGRSESVGGARKPVEQTLFVRRSRLAPAAQLGKTARSEAQLQTFFVQKKNLPPIQNAHRSEAQLQTFFVQKKNLPPIRNAHRFGLELLSFGRVACSVWAMLVLFSAGVFAAAGVDNGGFESGTFSGWMADSNWVVASNSCGYYSGWGEKYWAWSGGKGEPATGVLKSKPFVLDKDAVHLLISGWSSIHGTGQPRRWNYVTLNLENGNEIDRVYAPDTTAFVPVFLDGSKHKGETVCVQAVDDADQPTYSMLCIDEVHTADLPPDYARAVRPLPSFNPRKSIRLEDENCLVEVSRANGSVTRLRDKRGGLDLILEPRLAGSYRFALPVPGKEPWQTIEANWVFGRDQRLSSHQIEDRRLTLRWNGPLRNYLGEECRADVTMIIELRHPGVLFRLQVDNHTACSVGEVYFPVIGGIRGLGTTQGQLKATRMIRPTGTAPLPNSATNAAPVTFVSADIFRIFDNMSWLGDQGPEQFFVYPAEYQAPKVDGAPKIQNQPEPWIGFHSPKTGRSALISALDPARRRLYLRLELVPASSGTPRDDGNWPRPEELHGVPVGVEFSFVDIAERPAAQGYEAAPVFLQFVNGGEAEMQKAYLSSP